MGMKESPWAWTLDELVPTVNLDGEVQLYGTAEAARKTACASRVAKTCHHELVINKRDAASQSRTQHNAAQHHTAQKHSMTTTH